MTRESRSYIHYLEDMLESMRRIQNYTDGLTFEEFTSSTLKMDAVIRNLEIIGEASKNVPDNLKNKYPEIPWRSMYGLRNYVVHEYFGIDFENIWKIIREELPNNFKELERIIAIEK
ncbi:HepT-like ribonuclease domain-containing protein [Rhodohalobacter sp. 8-1]|uniref:HepT-like ribonuclease domain-containing protein n=1 Tax=Rhodohalobacter sp. 8-1 TaxID=3131972 RepID=UPI0030EE0386